MKSEDRRPKSERKPKAESLKQCKAPEPERRARKAFVHVRTPSRAQSFCGARPRIQPCFGDFGFRLSDFEFLSDFGLRISDFTLPLPLSLLPPKLFSLRLLVLGCLLFGCVFLV